MLTITRLYTIKFNNNIFITIGERSIRVVCIADIKYFSNKAVNKLMVSIRVTTIEEQFRGVLRATISADSLRVMIYRQGRICPWTPAA